MLIRFSGPEDSGLIVGSVNQGDLLLHFDAGTIRTELKEQSLASVTNTGFGMSIFVVGKHSFFAPTLADSTEFGHHRGS